MFLLIKRAFCNFLIWLNFVTQRERLTCFDCKLVPKVVSRAFVTRI